MNNANCHSPHAINEYPSWVRTNRRLNLSTTEVFINWNYNFMTYVISFLLFDRFTNIYEKTQQNLERWKEKISPANQSKHNNYVFIAHRNVRLGKKKLKREETIERNDEEEEVIVFVYRETFLLHWQKSKKNTQFIALDGGQHFILFFCWPNSLLSQEKTETW